MQVTRACTHKRTHTSICTFTYITIHTRTRIHTHARLHTHTRAHTHTHTHTHTETHTHKHTRSLTHTRTHTQTVVDTQTGKYAHGYTTHTLSDTAAPAISCSATSLGTQPAPLEALHPSPPIQCLLWVGTATWLPPPQHPPGGLRAKSRAHPLK